MGSPAAVQCGAVRPVCSGRGATGQRTRQCLLGELWTPMGWDTAGPTQAGQRLKPHTVAWLSAGQELHARIPWVHWFCWRMRLVAASVGLIGSLIKQEPPETGKGVQTTAPLPNLTSGFLISLFPPSWLRLGFEFEWEGAIASLAWSSTDWLVSHLELHKEFLLFLAPLQGLGAAAALLQAGHQGVKSQPFFSCSPSL